MYIHGINYYLPIVVGSAILGAAKEKNAKGIVIGAFVGATLYNLLREWTFVAPVSGYTKEYFATRTTLMYVAIMVAIPWLLSEKNKAAIKENALLGLALAGMIFTILPLGFGAYPWQ